ncbi:hypothetical protein C7293_00830 [filamentous cyanobacterium CCT1]|nr:hypothetical protein C7293_00830 [filamentous cyanobacterium CCT1]PSN80958.1 hypothetical protein C8B47_03835 [filamentous cyanobacterium CCP4]
MHSYYPKSYDYYTDERNAFLSTPSQENYGSTLTAEIIILEPASFTEISEAIHALRSNQMVVLNLMKIDFEEAQRCVDFLAGSILMINGTVEKIDEKIFIFAPYSAEIIAEHQQNEDRGSQ